MHSILIINSGSSSLRFALFKLGESLSQILTGSDCQTPPLGAGVQLGSLVLFENASNLANESKNKNLKRGVATQD